MSAGGYQVMPSELRDVAVAYRAQADAVAQALARFNSAWQVSDGTFGRLPNAKSVAEYCQEIHDQANRHLTKMHHELLAGAVKLAAAADVYQAADQAVEYCLRHHDLGGIELGHKPL